MASSSEGRWHRVCLNTIVRKGVALDSDRLRILPMGSKVFVVEYNERRVRIEQPIHGWCSLKSSNGDTILAPVEDANATQRVIPQTPMSSAANQGKSKAQNFKARKEEAGSKAQAHQNNINNLVNQLPQSEQAALDFTKNKELLQRQINELEDKLKTENPSSAEVVRKLAQAVEDKEKSSSDAELYGQMEKAAAAEFKNLQMEYQKLAQQGTAEQSSSQKYYSRDVIKFSSGLAVVRYYGPVDNFDCNLLGLEYSDPVGDSDGTINGKQYFECEPNFGAFVREDDSRIGRRLPAEKLLLQLHRYTEQNQQEMTAVQ